MNLDSLLSDSFVSRSKKETKFYSTLVAKTIRPPYILYLDGEVGVGKTCFVKSYAGYYNMNDITSSSFSRIAVHRGEITLIHCDFYRGVPSESFYYEEIEHHLTENWVLIIEWGKNFLSDLNYEKYRLNISFIENLDRKFEFKNF
tara:strand:+ start:2100 stop:2534 length:435 start_codon:yes stop_codon:yes gene_type:complete